MMDGDKDLVFSEAVKAGKRIYYFDVKQSRNGDKYIAITESKKITQGPADSPQFTFEKHKLFLYREDYQKFSDALAKVIGIASEGQAPHDYFSPRGVYEDAQAATPAEAEEEPQEEKDSLLGDAATALDDLIKF